MENQIQLGKKFGSDDILNSSCSYLDSPRTELKCFYPEDTESHLPTKSVKHVLEFVDSDSHCILTKAVTIELKNRGIETEINTRSRSKSRNTRNNTNHDNNTGMNKPVEAQLNNCDVKVYVPCIIKQSCEYIREHIQTQGIFRKSGSAARVQCIWQRFLNQDAKPFSSNDTVFEVASVLKQYLREMSSPLIPYDIHHILLRCVECDDSKSRIEAVLLAMCFLPISHISILSYLTEFLYEVTQHSTQNSMGCKNLAIVIGPNIMPVEQKKSDKSKDALNNEMKLLEVHARVIEILIHYGDFVGRITFNLETTLESLLNKNSEDELENEGGKRKKRRSGSLTRVLGFLKKVTNGKSGESSVPATPGDATVYTPIIKGSNKKRMREDFPFSQNRKKTVLDAVRKVGLSGGDDGRRVSATDTPNSLSALIACPSPAICLNPSPMKSDWKNTPNGVRLKNLVTPSLLRKKAKRSPSTTPSIVEATNNKSMKPKLGFGKKQGKKQILAAAFERRKSLGNQKAAISSVSIHRLANSPRASKLHRNPSTKIPRPDNPYSLRRQTSSTSLLNNEASHADNMITDTVDGGGEYVTLSACAKISDEKNEAFIASSISLNDTSQMNESSQDKSYTFPLEKLRLSPLIQEIDNLTFCAHNDVGISSDESNIPTTASPATSVDKLEDKFNKAVIESKIINIVNRERIKQSDHTIKRRFSVQEKGVSPSQRKIRAIVRRKSHEIGRVAPLDFQSPKFMSLRSPKSRPTPPPDLCRSPSRCTLRRGRPNTMRVGLARPSPVRGTASKLNSSSSFSSTPTKYKNVHSEKVMKGSSRTPTERNKGVSSDFKFAIPTPLRRMSSVHELVQIMEKTARETCVHGNDNCSKSTLGRISKTDSKLSGKKEPNFTVQDSTSVGHLNNIQRDDAEWTDGGQFDFNEGERVGKAKAERDSIHVLKTLNAGKVSENVKLFDRLQIKSPTKSLIPRLTSLYANNTGSTTTTTNATSRKSGSYIKADPTTRQKPLQLTNTHRMIRRFSAAELKNKHEQKLETVKKEVTVRRSATTTGTCNLALKQKLGGRRGNSNAKESAVINGPRRTVPIPSADLQENPQLQDSFAVILEDESLTTSVQKAIQNILGSKLDFSNECNSNNKTPSHGSALKNSNLANVNINKDMFITPHKLQFSTTTSLSRVTSERGTKSTSNSQTAQSTPRIRKALTTRAYDKLNTPHKVDTFYTPRRSRMKPRGLNDIVPSNTPLKAQHNLYMP